jgi:hypothetical protein
LLSWPFLREGRGKSVLLPNSCKEFKYQHPTLPGGSNGILIKKAVKTQQSPWFIVLHAESHCQLTATQMVFGKCGMNKGGISNGLFHCIYSSPERWADVYFPFV